MKGGSHLATQSFIGRQADLFHKWLSVQTLERPVSELCAMLPLVNDYGTKMMDCFMSGNKCIIGCWLHWSGVEIHESHFVQKRV